MYSFEVGNESLTIPIYIMVFFKVNLKLLKISDGFENVVKIPFLSSHTHSIYLFIFKMSNIYFQIQFVF